MGVISYLHKNIYDYVKHSFRAFIFSASFAFLFILFVLVTFFYVRGFSYFWVLSIYPEYQSFTSLLPKMWFENIFSEFEFVFLVFYSNFYRTEFLISTKSSFCHFFLLRIMLLILYTGTLCLSEDYKHF